LLKLVDPVDVSNDTIGTFVMSEVAGIYTVEFTIDPCGPDSYNMTITAVDSKGNLATETFMLEVTTKLTGYYVDLEEEWNLFSLPLIPDDASIEVILADVMENVSIVWSYTDGEWLSYIPGLPEGYNELTTMEDGIGYWIQMTTAGTLAVSGIELPGPGEFLPVYDVYDGWNLIGFKSVDSMDIDHYLTTIPTAVRDSSVGYGWDPSIQEYEMVYLARTVIHENLYPGQGYWLYVTEDASIAPPEYAP